MGEGARGGEEAVGDVDVGDWEVRVGSILFMDERGIEGWTAEWSMMDM